MLFAVCCIVIGRFCSLCAFRDILLQCCIRKIHTPIRNILDIGNQAVLPGRIQSSNAYSQNPGSFFSCNQFFHMRIYASLLGLPVPFAAVHLLFINLLMDSMPAIALGAEPHTDEVMSEKPRPRSEGILTRPFLLSVGIEGLVIAAATIAASIWG